ncbi:MAG: class IV adenylate cyclase [Sedimentisphaerales bacterium]|nr:class IV adenylate cyclase [Sedimentisphaerales bacterium]MBN2843486.1 class IV adenylate cyclase [Sedimentisphaerales bacterium]
MNLEVEAKFKVKDIEPFEQTLIDLEADFVHIVRQTDTYFSSHKVMRKGTGMRIRKEKTAEDEITWITFKGPRLRGEFKSRNEIELQVDDADKALTLLQELTLNPTLTIDKLRKIYELDGCQVCLDKVNRLGMFIEIEGPDDATIEAVRCKIGLRDYRHLNRGYAHMMSNLNKKLRGED